MVINKTYNQKGLHFLSNMFICDIIYKNKKFKSSEHLYQYLKVDETAIWWLETIRNAEFPAIAKKLTKNKKCPLKQDYKKVSLENMWLCLYLKFNQNPELKLYLTKVPDEDLTEYNYWNDRFWGISIQTEKGKDMLGYLYRNLKKIFIKELENE